MIEVFVLIGWIDGISGHSGGAIGQEFNSLETCQAAKTLYIQKNKLEDDSRRGRFIASWVECVKK